MVLILCNSVVYSFVVGFTLFVIEVCFFVVYCGLLICFLLLYVV